VTRFALACGLCGLTILMSLATAILQSENRVEGLRLDALKEECDLLEAANGEGCERILAWDQGPLPVEVDAAGRKTNPQDSPASHRIARGPEKGVPTP
jgi:hypothetical protein